RGPTCSRECGKAAPPCQGPGAGHAGLIYPRVRLSTAKPQHSPPFWPLASVVVVVGSRAVADHDEDLMREGSARSRGDLDVFPHTREGKWGKLRHAADTRRVPGASRVGMVGGASWTSSCLCSYGCWSRAASRAPPRRSQVARAATAETGLSYPSSCSGSSG